MGEERNFLNLRGSIPLCIRKIIQDYVSPSTQPFCDIYLNISLPRLHVSILQWSHHQACIIKLKMYVHEQLACHWDPVWFMYTDIYI
jgi:hypothetical protein